MTVIVSLMCSVSCLHVKASIAGQQEEYIESIARASLVSVAHSVEQSWGPQLLGVFIK